MLYVLILAFVLTCVSCGETHALSFSARTNKEGLSARTNEDSGPLDPSRRWLFGLVSGVISIVSGSRTMGWWKRGSTDVSLN
ncbi:hypothetical protein DPMN_041012 [Dreissena polymorpha]|uniref:Secreted protein n=1 Tax=Dreissena polymorpha TaxID=45954 RepID=A0A9D4HVU5_DREPO|nr:hypothetical protein DPMN_041012 [Dreissena polymorpha]